MNTLISLATTLLLPIAISATEEANADATEMPTDHPDLIQDMVEIANMIKVESPHKNTYIGPMFVGCGRTDLPSSQQYALINQKMHERMAINFTGNPEFDFNAVMMPHHFAAVEMCEVYLNPTSRDAEQPPLNPEITGLCYNITNGPKDMGKWQSDFSQPGETAQMLSVIELLGMVDEYETGCSELTQEDRDRKTKRAGYEIFMGCGKLGSPMTKDYLDIKMKMHKSMALEFTGDADIDFLLQIIPHYQSALDMCDVYYKYWACADSTNNVNSRVCYDFDMETISNPNDLSFSEMFEVLASMHHICTEHIVYTQPKELEWMKAELKRLSPAKYADYESHMAEGTYPCSSSHDISGGNEAASGGMVAGHLNIGGVPAVDIGTVSRSDGGD